MPADASAELGDESEIVLFDGTTNPELDYWELPDTGGSALVLETTLDGLVPSTNYLIQVRAEDANGTWSRSEVGTFTTPAATQNEIVLFRDTEMSGYSIPNTMVQSDVAPNTGTHHFEYTFECPSMETSCFENLRRQGIGTDLGAIDATAFEAAFLEIYFSSGDTRPSWWSQVRLMFQGGGGPNPLYGFEALTLPGTESSYRRVQVPLKAMTYGGENLTHATLAMGLHEWGIGARWVSNAVVRVDDVRIRY